MKQYFVYIISNYTNIVLYIGVTNNLERRIAEHKSKLIPGFSSKYHLYKLLYFAEFYDINDAIATEKKIKGWTRQKKIGLIKTINPNLVDLSKNSPSPYG